MSLFTNLGSVQNLLDAGPENCAIPRLQQPILSEANFSHLRQEIMSHTIKLYFKYQDKDGLKNAIKRISEEAVQAVENGNGLIILDDEVSGDEIPVPTLMATGAVHHSLIKNGLRSQAGLIIRGGDIFETHHYATLLGYGADAIYPYLLYATIYDLIQWNLIEKQNPAKAVIKYIESTGKGLLKIMSKIGISTLQSYKGSQIFEIIGIHPEVVNACFSGSISRISGMTFEDLQKEIEQRYVYHLGPDKVLDVGGSYQWKQNGEYHLHNPQTIHLLQYSTRKNDYSIFRKYSKLINDQSKKACTIRGLLEFKDLDPIPLKEVEPAENIMTRFATGAMSFGSISYEAHTTLAIAMNRIGGKSNSGEGGEDPRRYQKKKNGDFERSAIKQVASGRFGVTSYYLSQATELQIKMAQGAKPGEGGQLPGHKVNDWIAKTRHSTPGVGLISPPPHHDIYSIEDLAQLIFDLKNSNPDSRINVKLVSKAGVGIIASGVAKAHADAILISGHDGGTGASPLTSIKHAGLPWELGIAESHQTMIQNRLRDRVVLQTDGQLRTGRDIAIATLLGAEEWGVATAALIVEGCIMMRKCHLNTCPVGIATQDEELRKKFNGDPDHVINFFKFVTEELREIMAELGFRTVNEMIGRSDKLKSSANEFWKYSNLDLSPILYQNKDYNPNQYCQTQQDHGIDDVLDKQLIERARFAIDNNQPLSSSFFIKNTDRAVGAMLSYEISKKYGEKGLKEDMIDFRFRGSAGQSFAAFAASGLKFTLEGEANDYFGKGLSGAKVIASPDRNIDFDPTENIIIGNVAFYGATSGEAFIKGMAGERFCVRNSGVTAVVEGIGDHGCEYMTGGTVLILGNTGKNFGAGMSGGLAYIYNGHKQFDSRCNKEMVDLESPESSDFEFIRKLIRRHCFYTSSKRGFYLLSNWETEKNNFIKVFPKEYKRVLKEKNSSHIVRLKLSNL
jgi:glutamate synthase (NADPH/NADH) large chain